MPRVGLVQMMSSTSVHDNLNFVANCLRQAKDQNVELVLLPENFAYMGELGANYSIAET